jgi:uncharacterized protein (UPF0210 family)
MKIRSITCFYYPGAKGAGNTLDMLSRFSEKAVRLFREAGFEVQSRRLATVPFAEMCLSGCLENGIILAKKLEEQALERGFAYVSLGPALPEQIESYAMIPEMLAATNSVFFGANLLDKNGKIIPPAIRAAAGIIHKTAVIEKDGFANLRFAALAGVKPFTPFFPAAYGQGAEPAFSIAVECADVFVAVFKEARNFQEARRNSLKVLEGAATQMTEVYHALQQEFPLEFKGFDFSPAPYPGEMSSLGYAIESLGVPALGGHGSAAAAAFLAGILDEGNWQKVGFNGLMLPVLEDTGLAERADQGSLEIDDLLLYSCLCGTGLDTVPLPGDTSPEQIVAVLMDLAGISARLSKPLTARLMPIPGKKAGDAIRFDFEYFASSRVMGLRSREMKRFFAGEEPLEIYPRRIR